MIQRFVMAGVFGVLLVGAVGCHEPAAPAGPTVERVTVEQPEDFEILWETTADVLRAHNLWPDRQDRRARVITTLPDTAPAWFEFWRPCPTDRFHRGEAELQTVRRQAAVQFEPVADADAYDMSVRVDVYRYSIIERQVTTTASAFQMFGAKLPTVAGRVRPRQESGRWEPLGRDGTMERALADRIVARYGGAGGELGLRTQD
jgi:hypothetical protein